MVAACSPPAEVHIARPGAPHRDERRQRHHPPRDPVQLHLGGRSAGHLAPARPRGLVEARGAPCTARDRPQRAAPHAVLRGDLDPPPEPVPLPGARRLRAPPATLLRQHREGPRDRRPERERRDARARGARRLPRAPRRVPRRGGGRVRAPPPHGARARRGRRQGQRPLRPVHARLARDRRDRLAPPPPDRGGDAGRRGAGRAAPRRDRPARAQGRAARRRDRAHRRRGAAPARLRHREHREAEPDPRDLGARVPARGRAGGARGGDGPRGGGRHRARDGARGAPRARVRDRPDERLGLHDRRQHRRERRREGLRPLRHLHRQPPVVADGDALRPALDHPARRPPAPQDPPRRRGHLRRRGRGREARAAHLAARLGDPRQGALEGHHEQGARRGPRPAEGGHRRRRHLGRVRALPGVRGEADPLPGVLRTGLRRGQPRHPRAVARLPVPERGPRGPVGARALRRRVRPGHRLQGEGAAGGDAEGGAPHRRRGPRTGRGRAGRGPDAADPRRAPEHPHVRGARRRRGEALLGGPQEARRHRPAHERLQAERGHRPPARGARRVRPVRRRR